MWLSTIKCCEQPWALCGGQHSIVGRQAGCGSPGVFAHSLSQLPQCRQCMQTCMSKCWWICCFVKMAGSSYVSGSLSLSFLPLGQALVLPPGLYEPVVGNEMCMCVRYDCHLYGIGCAPAWPLPSSVFFVMWAVYEGA